MVLLNLSNWTAETLVDTAQPGPTWTLGPGNLSVSQSTNNDPSVFCGGFYPFGSSVEGIVSMQGADDDWVGFTYGYSPGDLDGDGAESDFLLIDWKGGEQQPPGRLATYPAGLFATRVFGIPTEDTLFFRTSIEGEFELLQLGANLGMADWVSDRDYHFRFEFGCSAIQMYVDGELEIDLPYDLYPNQDGEFCFFASSQYVTFADFDVEVDPSVCPAPSTSPTSEPTGAPTPDEPVCELVAIDFEDYAAGDVPFDLGHGIIVRGSGRTAGAGVMVFDTANPTGEDEDLGSSNLGKVLILSEDTSPEDPDDDAAGGYIRFAFDPPATRVVSVDLKDFDTVGSSMTGKYADRTVFGPIMVNPSEDGAEQTVLIGESNVGRLRINLAGSGGIDNLTLLYCAPV